MDKSALDMVDGGRNPTRMMSLSAGQKIVSATFKTGSWLDSVTFKLNTGKTFKIGRNGGSKEETDNIPAKSNYRWRLRIIHQWRLFEELGFDNLRIINLIINLFFFQKRNLKLFQQD